MGQRIKDSAGRNSVIAGALLAARPDHRRAVELARHGHDSPSGARRKSSTEAICRAVTAVAWLASAACAGGPETTGPGGEPAVDGTGVRLLTVFPVPLDSLSIIPLGWLSPTSHTLPTDHIYLIQGAATGPGMGHLHATVVAPAPGVVLSILTRETGDAKVVIGVTSTFRYYFDHVVLDAGIVRGTRLAAGARIGTTTGTLGNVDFGVANDAHENAFANPSRYGHDTRHADSPIRYFAEPLRSALYARVLREGDDKDGQVAQDVPGTLAGAWFLSDLPNDPTSTGPDGWAKELAFVADPLVPSRARVSIGGQLALPGLWTLAPGDPAFQAITPGRGAVTLRLIGLDPNYPERPGVQVGIMLVEMSAPGRLRTEVFPNATGPVAFTAAAREYLR